MVRKRSPWSSDQGLNAPRDESLRSAATQHIARSRFLPEQFARQGVRQREDHAMSDNGTLINTLRRTYDRLRDIRRDVASGKHIEAMFEIDALVGIAEQITLRQLEHIDPIRDPTAR